MRISDWSSDVCSSDLNSLAEVTAIDLLNSIVQRMLDQVASGQSNNSNQADSENLRQFNEKLARVRQRLFERESTVNQRVTRTFEIVDRAMLIASTLQQHMRSEERREGKECVRKSRT